MTIIDSLYWMARNVMLRAFRDLRCRNGIEAEAIRQDAKDFLTAATPDHQMSLETWCAFARLDPNLVIRRTQDYLEKGSFIALS